MTPQDKALLTKLTMAAKKIVYDPQRFKIFLKMLGTQAGAVIAVHAVIAVISKATQIPPELLPQLGVNTYLVMVDVAQHVTGHKADPKIVHQVIQAIMSQSGQSAAPAAPSAPAAPAAGQAPNPPATMGQGIIGSQMGAAQ